MNAQRIAQNICRALVRRVSAGRPDILDSLRSLRPALSALCWVGSLCCAAAGNSPSPASSDALPPATTNAFRAGAINTMEALDDKHILAGGDVLSFRIVEDEEEPKRLMVTDSGELEVPYIGRFAALGKTSRQLACELRRELEKDYYYQATVIVAVDVMARSRGRVYIVGPVRAPGPQEIPGDEVLTLSKAILRAGGFTDLADRKNIRVTRRATGGDGMSRTMTVNVAEILERGRTETDIPLETDDLILVPERLIRF